MGLPCHLWLQQEIYWHTRMWSFRNTTDSRYFTQVFRQRDFFFFLAHQTFHTMIKCISPKTQKIPYYNQVNSVDTQPNKLDHVMVALTRKTYSSSHNWETARPPRRDYRTISPLNNAYIRIQVVCRRAGGGGFRLCMYSLSCKEDSTVVPWT